MDKREAVRVPVQVPARCRVDGVTIAGLVEDVSKSGLFLRVDPNEIEAGSEVELQLDLPGEETLQLQVHVVRRVEADAEGRTGMAMKFAGDPMRARMPLANFIMKQHQTRH